MCWRWRSILPQNWRAWIPSRDYLLGTAEKVFKDTDVLFDELADKVEVPVEFYVYNADTDEVARGGGGQQTMCDNDEPSYILSRNFSSTL